MNLLTGRRERIPVLDRLSRGTVQVVCELLYDLPRDYPDADAWLRRRLNDALIGRAECWIAGWDGLAAGVAILTPKPGALKLSTIYVDPRFRNRGLGALLMDRVVGDVNSRKADEIYVTVAQHTVPLLRPLLDSRGFTLVATERHRYGWGRHEAVFSRLSA